MTLQGIVKLGFLELSLKLCLERKTSSSGILSSSRLVVLEEAHLQFYMKKEDIFSQDFIGPVKSKWIVACMSWGKLVAWRPQGIQGKTLEKEKASMQCFLSI